MPGKGQKAVTVSEEIYERVRREVEAGRERSIAKTFVKAVEYYLGEKENLRTEFVTDVSWLLDKVRELREPSQKS
ncbi:hypothetical protein LCGC14_2546620 [marine sediment metagenome]|uniref:Uncharacterized protein n=1 Tax=marine sediment metagenome TaxID=412755 RepID=A0A0F9D0L3_9ZZZZ|nr:hypothetical protein [Nitrospirota bacterium]